MANNISFNVINYIDEVNAEISNKLGQQLLKSAILLRNELVRNLSGQGAGKRYRVAGTNRFYTASVAGAFPATRLGNLKKSYKYKVMGQGVKMKAFVGSDLPYAHYLEYGTYKMAPRPHLIPTMKQVKPKIERLFKGIL
jgi:HK97 gp10 family phage protein